MKRIAIAASILLLAIAFYAVGYTTGGTAIIAVGFVLEASFWLGLFQAKRNRALAR